MARIPARSHREAMDWSLVLVSQGIEPILAFDEETAGWGLLIQAGEEAAALEAIRLYDRENRHWPWRREVLQSGLLFDWGSLAWAVLVACFFWADTRLNLASAGVMDNLAFRHHQWWRVFTAVWLHADLAHLASNAVLGFILLGLTMARYGSGAGLLGAYLTGAGGNLAIALFARSPHLSLGASGMVMGCLGLLAVQALRHTPGQTYPSKRLAGGVSAGILLFLFLGVAPGTDVLAHAGGFVTGLLLGAFARLLPGLLRKTKTDSWCGPLFVLLVVWPWWSALRH